MQTITAPGEIILDETQWWFVYNSVTSKVIIPPRCLVSGKISSPHTLVIGETKEECEDYITQNNLITDSN